MKISFFGYPISFSSNSALWTATQKQKFGAYLPGATHSFPQAHAIKIDVVHTKITTPKISDTTIYWGENVWCTTNGNQQTITLHHHYLTTKTSIEATYQKESLQSISISMQSSFLFEIFSFLTGGLLKKQLYLQITKKYIEHPLLGYLCLTHELECVHAAALEKDAQVLVFAGLNAVGKSSLATYLVKTQGYTHFADNYLLLNQTTAFKTPDAIRLAHDSQEQLATTSSQVFGFGKNVVANPQWSTLASAAIKTFYLVSRGESWQTNLLPARLFSQKLSYLQQIFAEQVVNTAVLLPLHKKIAHYKVPTAQTATLQIGSWETISHLKLL